jgi:alpha-N-arabinofuranosidase
MQTSRALSSAATSSASSQSISASAIRPSSRCPAIETLAKALRIDEFITQHSALMDKADPDRKVSLMVDEWGTWYTALPGSNPGFLQQQNSLRDALVAAIHLNIFSRHAARVKMANIAQMVNVLQAMILTSDEKMVLTPTYHVFQMYKPLRDATLLPLILSAPDYRHGEFKVPARHGTAARGKGGKTYVALTNLDANNAAQISLRLTGVQPSGVSGQTLTAGAINAINTFDKPDRVTPQAFNGAKLKRNELSVDLPSKSVVVLSLQ